MSIYIYLSTHLKHYEKYPYLRNLIEIFSKILAIIYYSQKETLKVYLFQMRVCQFLSIVWKSSMNK